MGSLFYACYILKCNSHIGVVDTLSVPRTQSTLVRHTVICDMRKQQPVANNLRSGDTAIAAIGFGKLHCR